MKIDRLRGVLAWVYVFGMPVTFIYLTFFDGYRYTAWNWLIAIPVNVAMSGLWPIYWGILRPIFE